MFETGKHGDSQPHLHILARSWRSEREYRDDGGVGIISDICRQHILSDREMKNFTNYLLDPTRFSELVARWWEERKVKEGEGMICPICGRLLIMWNECEEWGDS